MTIDLAQFHEMFFQESAEALDTMEQTLLQITEGTVEKEQIDTIFRVAHSIKGGSATFGFTGIASFTHTIETLLDLVRTGRIGITPNEMDLLLRSVDVMREMLSAEQYKRPLDEQAVADLQDSVKAVIARSSGAAPTPVPAPAAVEPGSSVPVPAAPAPAAAPGAERWRIGFRPGENLLARGNDPLRIFRELSRLGEMSVRVDAAGLPPLAQLDPHRCYLNWNLELAGPREREALDQVFDWIGDDADIRIDAPVIDAPVTPAAPRAEGSAVAPKPAPEPMPAAAAQPAPVAPAAVKAPETRAAGGEAPKAAPSESTSIRVSIEKIDELINTVGELVITQSMLSQLMVNMDGPQSEELRNGLGHLERQMRALQESVMRVRMLPISFVFNRFPRMVRDLSQKLGKKVELRMTGEQTELDKTVLEKIGDPLVHLVRNSIDHGIETVEGRRVVGKPEAGTIHLNAYHKGGNIIVEVIDDGAGLNRERILAKARERGLIGPDEELSDDRIYNLIFQPGFSTAEQVTDVSGRGVGMDVVRRNIMELGGNVQIFSNADHGSTVRIRLPLTLAILDGQLVRVGREVYVIPLVSIVETIQIRREQINSVAGGRAELLRLREECIPILRLYQLFEVEADTTELDDGLLTIVESDGQRMGIFVDELQAQQQVVIKSLETNFRQLTGISGATMLGDGRVALILDVPGLISLFESREKQARDDRQAAVRHAA
ncbi:MAG: chemotaxis protein CheA [Gammaproteobacteria bacterium]|nr:chemotaxis protein CheA [Gammaproteobacteria bacterium]